MSVHLSSPSSPAAKEPNEPTSEQRTTCHDTFYSCAPLHATLMSSDMELCRHDTKRHTIASVWIQCLK